MLSTAALAAQVPPRDQSRSISTGTGEISGSVVLAADPSQPVRRALVALTRSGTEDTRTVITDASGRFAFSALPAGRYALSAKKDPLLYMEYGAVKPGQPGSAIVLAEGQRFAAKPMALTPGGVLAGRVTDRSGRGLNNVAVRASAVVVVGGERRERISITSSANTNAHGEYRIFGLMPGEYVLSVTTYSVDTAVTPAELAWASRPEGTPPPPGRPFSFAPTMFPGTADANAAQVITLGHGEQRLGLDFAMQYVPVASVTVNVTGPDGLPARGATLTQTQKRPNPFVTTNVSRRPVGVSNVVTGVTPGDYVFFVRSNSAPILWGLAETTVAGEDLTLNIRLRPALSVSGRVEFRSASGAAQPDPARVTIRVGAAVSIPGISDGVGTARPDGTFTVDGLIPGASVLGASISGEASTTWFFQSAMLGGVELLDAPLQVGSVDASNIVITFTDTRTQVAGTLTDAAGQPAPLYVLLFSADRGYWKSGSRRINFARANDAGHYEINGLPPGDYYLCAMTEVDLDLRSEPTYLEQLLPAAIKLTLGEGEKKRQDLQVGR